ncbi:MAG: hypothetical protein SOR31_04200 [Parvimonas sp.]|uniref:VirB4 family type IV secretion system protein n=1 Tax=Parvimonas sp. TaxID=1944660 RepID=UPI002A74D251|nr:hypothetical protein [Parvimonas sp.]MDY3050818.1 hypothetical protein [Parvimonas sp.]
MKLNFIKKNKDETEEKKIDYEFIDNIQAKTNMIFKENFVKKGDGYETCIHIHTFPEKVSNFWLKIITDDLDMDNIVITIDVGTMDKNTIDKKMETNLVENLDRKKSQRKITEKLKSSTDFDDSINLHQKIYTSGISIKLVHIRIFVYSSSLENLESDINKILHYLKGKHFKAGIYLNELEAEYKSLYNSYTTQSEKFTKRYGKEINSDVLGAGLDYHFSSLDDDEGTFYGMTRTNGAVIFNPFLKNDFRKSYNGIILGQMGSGKSTFLKKLTLNEYVKGNKVRVFDASGEFKKLVNYAGGKIINLNNSKNIINPLQIYKSNYIDTSEDDEKEINFEDLAKVEDIDKDNKFYQNHISKVTLFFKYCSPELKEKYLDEFEIVLDEFYEKIGFFKRENNLKIFNNLTNRKVEEYPILSDLLEYIKIVYEVEKDEFRKERLDKIKLKLTKLVNSNGILFDGYSTINIQSEDLVVFNIRELATLPQEIFSAVIFNILSILWEEMINNVNIGKIGDRVDEFNIKKYFLLLDEAHRILNNELDSKIIKFFIDFQREARKYLGSIWFSYHTIDDAIKDDGESKKMNQLFNLSQYKILFEQDNQLKNKLLNVFKSNFNENEIDAISKFKIGECILSLHNQNNIIFKVSLGLKEEETLIATGGK